MAPFYPLHAGVTGMIEEKEEECDEEMRTLAGCDRTLLERIGAERMNGVVKSRQEGKHCLVVTLRCSLKH